MEASRLGVHRVREDASSLRSLCKIVSLGAREVESVARIKRERERESRIERGQVEQERKKRENPRLKLLSDSKPSLEMTSAVGAQNKEVVSMPRRGSSGTAFASCSSASNTTDNSRRPSVKERNAREERVASSCAAMRK